MRTDFVISSYSETNDFRPSWGSSTVQKTEFVILPVVFVVHTASVFFYSTIFLMNAHIKKLNKN